MWRGVKKHLFEILVLCIAYGIPIIGALPPAAYFRHDDFVWLTWASQANLVDTVFPDSLDGFPGYNYRPFVMLYWFVTYRLFGVSSAIPYVFLNSTFFAGALLLLFRWSKSVTGLRTAAAIAILSWVVVYYRILFTLLNVFNAGKMLNFLLVPLALWAWTTWATRKDRSWGFYLLAFLSTMIAGFARETAFLIIPAACIVYLFACRSRIPSGRLWSGSVGVVAVCAFVFVMGALNLRGFPSTRSVVDYKISDIVSTLGYYFNIVIWDSPARFLHVGILIVLGIARKSITLTILSLGALVVGYAHPTVGLCSLLAILIWVWTRRISPMRLLLSVWFLLGVAIPVAAPGKTFSYLMEASFPWAMIIAILSEPIVIKIQRSRLPEIFQMRRGRVVAGLLGVGLVVVGIGIGFRLYAREFRPYKEHSRDFMQANEFMIKSLPWGTMVYVLDNNTVYEKGMAAYVKKYRQFYVWTPDCWFTAYRRPDLKVYPWDRERPFDRHPSVLFASNRYEKEYFLDWPENPGYSVEYENPSCAVYRVFGWH